jgi:hypothetical protein
VLAVRGLGVSEAGLARVELFGELSAVCEAAGAEPRRPRSWRIDVNMEPSASGGDPRALSAEVVLDLARFASECGEAGAVDLSGWIQVRAQGADGAETLGPAFFFHLRPRATRSIP